MDIIQGGDGTDDGSKKFPCFNTVQVFVWEGNIAAFQGNERLFMTRVPNGYG